MFSNFMIHDIFASLFAFGLFPLIFVVPGYVSGWAFNLFSFRERLQFVRFVLAIPLFFSISPVILFLAVRLVSSTFGLGLLLTVSIAFITILWLTYRRIGLEGVLEPVKNIQPGQKRALILAAGWVIFSILFLVDLQSQGRLWLNSISYDYYTRVQVIEAITRTGAPPANPSYFPGHPEKLTFLYYFWYVLCSLVDIARGSWVEGRTALIASVAWCGLGMIAVTGLYLRLRGNAGAKDWKSALLGIGALAISGLDLFPALFFMLGTRLFIGRFALHLPGDIEQWNEQVTTWISSFAWVPNHVAAVIACLVGMILWQVNRRGPLPRRLSAVVVAGLGFASAFELSVWVTVIFALFWVVWMLVQFFQGEQPWPMAISGPIALMAVLPFVLDILQAGGGGTGDGIPLAFGVRPFGPLVGMIEGLPSWEQALIFFLALPLNYLFELGFFFLVAIIWPIIIGKGKWKSHAHYIAEGLLLLVTAILVTFVRSTAIANNDFGWRGWLLGQFILLIWGVDILEYFQGKQNLHDIKMFKNRIPMSRVKSTLRVLMVLDIWTTVLSLAALRFWTVLVDAGVSSYPDQFSMDTNLGRKTYDGRQAFDYINGHTPQDVVVQFNPRLVLDCPTGLYRKRQTVIATHTLYGVPVEKYHKLAHDIG